MTIRISGSYPHLKCLLAAIMNIIVKMEQHMIIIKIVLLVSHDSQLDTHSLHSCTNALICCIIHIEFTVHVYNCTIYLMWPV